MHKLVEHLEKFQEHAEKHVTSLHSKVRTAVSKDKFRFQDGTFDLDLTYITNRIVAMGFPGTSFEKAWRNSCKEVREFFQQYHDQHYLVINVSERIYSESKFQRVQYFGWPDHHPPSLSNLLACVQAIDNFLQADPLNVVAIHCMAGRGRTGTVIAAYFLYIKMFSTAEDALNFFASRRSSTSEGVQVPSQKRYVDYFRAVIYSNPESPPILPIPRKLRLKCIIMRPVLQDFDLSGYFTPIVVIECFTPRQPEVIFSNQTAELKTFISSDSAVLIDTANLLLEGDIMVSVHSDSVADSLSEKPIFRFAFHTSFVHNYIMDFSRDQLDSAGAGSLRDERIPIDFCVRLIFTE